VSYPFQYIFNLVKSYLSVKNENGIMADGRERPNKAGESSLESGIREKLAEVFSSENSLTP
jgi:hypothetical protein